MLSGPPAKRPHCWNGGILVCGVNSLPLQGRSYFRVVLVPPGTACRAHFGGMPAKARMLGRSAGKHRGRAEQPPASIWLSRLERQREMAPMALLSLEKFPEDPCPPAHILRLVSKSSSRHLGHFVNCCFWLCLGLRDLLC